MLPIHSQRNNFNQQMKFHNNYKYKSDNLSKKLHKDSSSCRKRWYKSVRNLQKEKSNNHKMKTKELSWRTFVSLKANKERFLKHSFNEFTKNKNNNDNFIIKWNDDSVNLSIYFCYIYLLHYMISLMSSQPIFILNLIYFCLELM